MAKLSDLPKKTKAAISLTPTAIKAKFKDANIYLFGSYAKDSWLEESDIDIIVVSEAFKTMSWTERIGEIRKLLPKNVGYEILAYTPSEFREGKRRSIVISDAANYWIELD